MTNSQRFEPRNRILAALPDPELLNLQQRSKTVALDSDHVLFEADQPLTHLYFIETGAAAVLSLFNDHSIGVAAVGREGVLDAHTLLLGGDSAAGRCKVLVPGSALVVEVSEFRRTLRDSPRLRAVCESHSRALIGQMLQAVPCNKLHTTEQRCARWLLTCADHSEDDAYQLSRQGLAPMLGVAEWRWTVILQELHHAQLIRSDRGAIAVLNRSGLEAIACECYRITRDRYDGLSPRRTC